MKVYVSGSFDHRNKIDELVEYLEKNVPEFECTSTWLDAPDNEEAIDKLAKQTLIDEDFADIERSDVLLLVNHPELCSMSPGRWVEVGIALATGKMVVVWGIAQSSLFLHDDSVVWLVNNNRIELIMTLNAIRVTLNTIDEIRDAYRTNRARRQRRAGETAEVGPAEDRSEDPREGIRYGKGSALSDLDRAFSRGSSRPRGDQS